MKQIENIDIDYESIFEEPIPIDSKELIFNVGSDIDFNKLEQSNSYKRKATKPKNLTKKQRKTHNKMTKTSRRKNRH